MNDSWKSTASAPGASQNWVRPVRSWHEISRRQRNQQLWLAGPATGTLDAQENEFLTTVPVLERGQK